MVLYVFVHSIVKIGAAKECLISFKTKFSSTFLSVYVAKHVLDSVIPVLIGLIPVSDTGYYEKLRIEVRCT